MKKERLTSEQKRRIKTLEDEWISEIGKVPEMTLPSGTFNNALSNKQIRPYIELRDKYMALIKAVKDESE